MYRRFRIFAHIATFGVATAIIAGCGSGPAQLPPPEPPTVAVTKPRLTPLRPTKEFSGRLVTKDSVKVIPQVTGRLLNREFKDGDYVEEGKTVLFRIDPVLYKAEVEKAKADIAKAEADKANWTAQLARDKAEFERLNSGAKLAITKSDLDKAAASVKVDEAQIDLAKAGGLAADAALTKAEENLKYCTIFAPATGRLGQSLVSAGTIVDAYKTELVSVFPINPVYATFEIDELTSLWYREQIRAGAIADPRNPNSPLTVTIKLKNEKDFTTNPNDRSRNGVVDYIDPEIVRSTGTRTIRATLDNTPRKGPNGEWLSPYLSAGDSVRVRVPAGAVRDVLAVPESVVFSQQRKQYVYVVVDGKAQLREVEPGATFNGLVEVNRRASASATSGLDENDAIVADNLLRVRPGIPVTVK
ncbi:MAG TPA: efflux RND transporter periplasmic adaptor subunit [Gemmataceae bacterium]|jgi:RND family efflux transporter MFP subunit|nr:efflux RND transporter periplasmic adaptor subunit [Gemmataceae bacterium]